MILLTERERQQLRQATIGISRQDFDKYPPSEKRAHWNRLDKLIESIMLTHPEAFTARAIFELQDKIKNKESYGRY